MKFLAFLLLSLASVQAVLIPTNRLTDWTPGTRVGVPGGIPTNRTTLINVTQAPYNAPVNTTSDCQPAIQAAINAATAGQVVYMPAGTYRINSTINIPDNKDNVTLRGAGMSATILDNRANIGISVGDGDGADWDGFPHDGSVAQGWSITSGATQGSTSVVLSSATGIGSGGFAVGKLIKIAWGTRTESALIQGGLTGIGIGRQYNLFNSGQTGAQQISRITGISGSTITFSPALVGNYDDIAASSNRQKGAKASTTQIRNPVEGFGLEAFTLTNATGGGQNGIQMGGTYGCWILDVKSIAAGNYPFALSDNLNLEVRRCWAEKTLSGAPNGAGYLCNMTFFGLYEDNIVTLSFPGWEINFGSTNNVFAYNYGYDSSDKTMDINHGPHNIYNLYEGNIGSAIVSDGFFGGSEFDTIFRNWWNGEQGYQTAFKRFTRYLNLVGNVLGYTGGPAIGTPIFSFGQPNIGNSASTGTATPSAGDFWQDLNATGTLTTRSSNTTGTITWNAPAVSYTAIGQQRLYISWNQRDDTMYIEIPWPQANPSVTTFFSFSGGGNLPAAGTALELFTLPDGFQEFDNDVENTALQKANWASGHGYVAGTIGADTVPDSLFRSSKPTWFGTLTWPPFDPVTGTQGHTRIPAGYRYWNGVDPPTGEPDVTAPTPNPMTFASAPAAVDSVSVTMTASTASDAGGGINYFFDETTGAAGGTDSGWQSSPTYVDSGLTPSTLYTYRVKSRDASLNETAYSSTSSVTTSASPGGGVVNIETLNVTNLRVGGQ